jgi:hypothetical protein
MRSTILLAFVVWLPASAQAQQQEGRPGWPCAGKVDPAYLRTAEATGGSVMMFHPSELGGAAAEIIASQRHEDTILRAGDQVAEGVYEYDVPVDSAIESVYFQVSMQCLQVATIVTPSGEPLGAAAPGVEYHHFESIRLFVVHKPTPGLWKVTVGGRGLLLLNVGAKTGLTLGGVTFPQGELPLRSGSPAGRTLRVEATLNGDARQLAFYFVSPTGEPIRAFDLWPEKQSDDHRTYGGEVTTPDADFRVAVAGQDENGLRFQRVDPRLFMAR